VGVFSDKYNHSINSAVQLLAHVGFLKDLLLRSRLDEGSKLLKALQDVVGLIDSGQYRAVHSDVLPS
jgi:hypothetical protein